MTDRVGDSPTLHGAFRDSTILGGVLPEFSFNLIAGAPGAGKRRSRSRSCSPSRSRSFRAVLHRRRRAPLKMLRYQQQFTFFDMSRVNESVRYFNLTRTCQRHVGEALDASFRN